MYILIVAVIFIIALIAVRFSNKYGIPALLLFILLGISFNFFGVKFEDYKFVDRFSNVALLIIMFYGGFGTNWKMAKPVYKQSILMASFGVILTSLITGIFCYYVLGMNFLESMLLGSVIGSTDFASLSSILQSKNLNLKYSTASLLEIESGSNDPTAYTMTMIFLSMILGTKTSIIRLVLLQVLLGLLMGYLMSKLTEILIFKIRFKQDGLFTVLIASCALLTFSLTDILGGNGFLAVYLLGIHIGNLEYSKKKEIIFFFDGFSGIMQIGLFFFLGLLSNPKLIVRAFPVALVIMLFLTLIARPLSTYLLLKPFGFKNKQISVISIAGLRGAAAIAFAIMVINSDADLSMDLFHIVFVICLLSSFIQGSLMPILTERLKMVDPNDTVLKTFNYYNDQSEVGFIETQVHKGNNLIGKKVAELNLEFEVIVAKIVRNSKVVVPKGDTIIQEGDTIIIGGKSHFDPFGHDLMEMTIGNHHPWNNLKLKNIRMQSRELVVMLHSKDDEIIVPTGETKLNEGDKLIILKK